MNCIIVFDKTFSLQFLLLWKPVRCYLETFSLVLVIINQKYLEFYGTQTGRKCWVAPSWGKAENFTRRLQYANRERFNNMQIKNWIMNLRRIDKSRCKANYFIFWYPGFVYDSENGAVKFLPWQRSFFFGGESQRWPQPKNAQFRGEFPMDLILGQAPGQLFKVPRTV